MAIYSTFFVYAVDQLAQAFPGWKAPLPQPVERSFTNPFTGQTTTQLTREPTWDEDEDLDDEPGPVVVEIEGDYAKYLEGRLSPAVAAAPHWCAKGLTNLELDGLNEALGLSGASCEDALFCPPSWGAVLLGLAPALTTALVAANAADLPVRAKLWAAVMSRPEHTHSKLGRRVAPDWTPGDAIAILAPLVAVAAKVGPGKGLYLLIEA
jgi:hypothetical protein